MECRRHEPLGKSEGIPPPGNFEYVEAQICHFVHFGKAFVIKKEETKQMNFAKNLFSNNFIVTL